MLNRLSINNYALIDELSIDFKKGFTTITGETGAGLDAGGGATCSELPVKTGVRKTEGSLEVQIGIGLMILGQWTHKMK